MGLVLATTVNSISVWLLYVYIVYPAFLSPLSRIPAAHWTCHISSFWVLAARKLRRENKSLYHAHQRLGSVVRVGPHEVSVDGFEGVRAIYQGGFEKGHWYSVFDNYGVPNMFATTSSKPHSVRKRMISNVYSKSYIQSSQASKSQMAEILFTRVLPVLRTSSLPEDGKLAHRDIEVFSLYLAIAMDLITAYIFGLSGGTDFITQESYRRDWQEMYLARANYPFWTQEVPKFTAFCTKWFPWFRVYPEWVDKSNAELSRWNWRLYANVKKQRNGLNGGEKMNDADEPVVHDALQAGIDRESKTNGKNSVLYTTSILQRDQAIASELMDHSLAGQETAGIALAYATWHISRSPKLQRQLRDEIASLKPSLKFDPKSANQPAESTSKAFRGSAVLPDPKAIDSLPLLHAVVIETLRLHAPIPGPQPRQTPKDGCTIGGYNIPGGVRIASLAYTLHRDEEVFPQPEEWRPERWLPQTSTGKHGTDSQGATRLREMHRRLWAFGSGGRMCIGSNFAMNEMKFILAFIYANFQTTVVDDEGIEQEDAYTARPVDLTRRIAPFIHFDFIR
ncbi:hypothetical protein FDECE_17319 [Fusarium decemcellulare]|nr:hypothetical protein FDECE_17319 [Fusarium decemcellulare]